MTSVSLAIMAHPARSTWVDELRSQLGQVPVAWAEPPWATTTDRGPCWRTKRAALLLHGDSDYHCVVQDDALLAPDFEARVTRLVSAGDYLYMLFYRHKRTWPKASQAATAAVRRGDSHFIVRGMVLGVGIVVPTARIPDLIEFCDALDDTLGDDDRMKLWARARKIDTFVPIPSLVDHRVGRSLIGHPDRRVAWRFAS